MKMLDMMMDMVNRARMLIGMGMSDVEAAGVLAESGVSNEDAFLAVKGAVVMEED
jgi:hypothetical protein